MNRRNFLSTLAAVPGLGWLRPAEHTLPIYPLSPKAEAAVSRALAPQLEPGMWHSIAPRFFVGDTEVTRGEFYRANPEVPRVY